MLDLAIKEVGEAVFRGDIAPESAQIAFDNATRMLRIDGIQVQERERRLLGNDPVVS
jgi:hypothetical protein